MLRTWILTAAAAAAAATGLHFELVPHAGPLPVPTAQQLQYQGAISALIHFGMATFFHDGDPGCTAQNWNGCDPNGGCNSSDPNSFAPSNLNVTSWIQSMKDLGATSAVLTAKHGCGWLNWLTNTTLPNGQPYGYHVKPSQNVVQQFVDLAAQEGIGYGFYYSLTNNFYLNVLGHHVQPNPLPNQQVVTQAQYEDLAIAQMTELWSQFGALTEIWLDGGCEDLCPRVNALLNATLARDAVAFNGGGGTSQHAVRWCGTEGGNPSGVPTVWSTAACGWCPDGSGSGDRPDTAAAAWYPSGVDFTIQQGDHWFFMPGVPVHPLSDLVQTYHNSVGANGHLEIDFAIDRTGGIDPVHAATYKAFGDWIRACYGTPVATATSLPGTGATSLYLALAPSGTSIDRVMMQEDQTQGQLVITYVLQYLAPGGSTWQTFSAGTTIGAKRIDRLPSGPVLASALNLTITQGFAAPTGLALSAFSGQGCAV